MDKDVVFEGPYGPLPGVITFARNVEARKKVLILCHGFRGSMESGGRAPGLARMASEYCHVVRFNFSWCTLLSRQVEELKAVIDQVRRQFRPEKLYLLGRSLGGATVVITACGDDRYRPDGMILWATPASLPRTFVNVLGEERFKELRGGKDMWMEDERGRDLIRSEFVREIDNYDINGLLREWEAPPVLVIHGGKDEVVSPDQAADNSRALGEKATLTYIPEGDHSFTQHGDEAAEIVVRWLKEHV